MNSLTTNEIRDEAHAILTRSGVDPIDASAEQWSEACDIARSRLAHPKLARLLSEPSVLP